MRRILSSVFVLLSVTCFAEGTNLQWSSVNPNGDVKVVLEGSAIIDKKGTINIAPGKVRSGEVVLEFKQKEPFSKGEVIVPWLYLSNAPGSFDIEVSLDGKNYTSILPKDYKRKGYKTVSNLKFALPSKTLIGYREWFLRVRAGESSGKEQAATLGGLIVNYITNPDIKERKFQYWRICRLHPWVEADVKQLPVLLTEKIKHINLSGPRNDWLTGAVGIASDRKSEVRVKLESPKALKNRIELRVVGQVHYNNDVVWDPLIRKIDVPKAKPVLNYQQIKRFPLFTVLPKSPIFLWITIDLRNVKSGSYHAKFTFRDGFGNRTEIPLNVSVLDAELPIDSPLYYIAWQWWGKKMIPDFIEHGINVAWVNYEQAWKLGAKFLLFSHHHPAKLPDEKEKKKYLAWTAKRIKMIEKLKVPRGQWAFNPFDEPTDKTAKIILEYGKLIKEHFPDAPLWYDPAWIKPGFNPHLKKQKMNETTVDGCLKVINPVTDIWCPYTWHLWDHSGAFEYMKSTGKPMWAYDIWGNAARRPAVGRQILRTGPWMAWKYRLKGFGIFAANDWHVDVWEGRSGKAVNYSFTYPQGPDGRPISSRGYEAIRQGIQEYKRLYVLKKLGADMKVLDTLTEIALSAKSVKTFDSIRNQLDRMLVEYQNRNTK